ncbi:hypothetical protein F5144DRAFT_558928 [Chaetomium tenue]|uniref:Uncharacterized protein n=1 Tax=Chaetomium tenue TaxID=1854479 RepID=A0ACB7PSM9_9PEZI|nr:hypothetical protein F5144DRAFT_558928 [Chaetomium globosum]
MASSNHNTKVRPPTSLEVVGTVLKFLTEVIMEWGNYRSQRYKVAREPHELFTLFLELTRKRFGLGCVCEYLLSELVPVCEIRLMVDEAAVDLWRREPIQQKVWARLWDSIPVFLNAMSDIFGAIDEIKPAINDIMEGKVLTKGPLCREPLSLIKDRVAELDTLINDSIKLAPERKARAQAKLCMATQDMATSLYHALESQNHTGQFALKLQHRSPDIAPTDDRDRIMKDLAFQLSNSSSSTAYGHNKNLRTRILQPWQDVIAQPTQTPPPIPRNSGQTPEPVGIDDERVEPPRTHYIHPASAIVDRYTVSLSEILEQKSHFHALHGDDLLKLAIAISSSVLQLYGTPWLPHIFSSRDIFFLLTQQALLPSASYGDPVVIPDLHHRESQPTKAYKGLLPRPTLLSLGCLLMEVFLWKPLNSGRVPATSIGDRGRDLMADYKVARTLLKEVPWEYRSVVADCLGGPLHWGEDESSEDFFRHVYLRVVSPLQR